MQYLFKKNILFHNIFFSFFSQGINYVFPLITFPFLVRYLGIEKFGLVSFSQNIANYFITVIIFGFHLTGTNEVAKHSQNLINRNKIFHEILFARIFLFFICFLLFTLSLFFFDKLIYNKLLFILSFFSVLGWVFQSDYFFLGLQKMKILSIANFLSRLIAFLIIYYGVKNSQDSIIAVSGYGMGGLLGGIFCFIVAYKFFSLKFYVPTFNAVLKQILSGYHVFLSSMAVNLYSSSINLLILGFISNNIFVGYYSISDKIFVLFCAISIPLNQALFPYFSKLSIENFFKYQKLLKKVTILFVTCFLGLSIVLYNFAPFFIQLITGRQNIESIEILKILSFCLPMYPLGFTFTNIFIIHNKKKYITILNVSLVFINLLLILPFFYIWGLKGLAINNVVVFVAMTLIGFVLIKRNKIVKPIQ